LLQNYGLQAAYVPLAPSRYVSIPGRPVGGLYLTSHPQIWAVAQPGIVDTPALSLMERSVPLSDFDAIVAGNASRLQYC